MGRPSKIDKAVIAACAVRIAARSGPEGTTMRSISSSMGVSEAGLYLYYKSKEDILWSAHAQIVDEMANEKALLLKQKLTVDETLREWVRTTYRYFDRNPDAFAFVLLLPPPMSISRAETTGRQGRMCMTFIRRALRQKALRTIPPLLIYSHFSGILLNVPRLIREGILRGPAVRYSDAVFDATWRIIGPQYPSDLGSGR